MELEVAQIIAEVGLVMKGDKSLELSNKVRIPGTKGLKGYGMIHTISYQGGKQVIYINWAHPLDKPQIKVGDKIKFTRQ